MRGYVLRLPVFMRVYAQADFTLTTSRQESDGADGRHNRKQATPPEGNPRRGGFSLSVGKYVVKGVRRKKECLDLCCKYTCLRHIWQYAGGMIHRNLGCTQLRWQRQRGRQTFFRQFLRVNRRFCSVFFAFRCSLDPVFPRAPRLSVAVYGVRRRCSTYSGLARRLSLRKWSKLGWSASNISNPTEISGDGLHLRLQ